MKAWYFVCWCFLIWELCETPWIHLFSDKLSVLVNLLTNRDRFSSCDESYGC
jgi:hypothetical protein